MLAKSADPIVRILSKRMDLVLEKSDMVDLMLGGRHGMVVGSSYGHSLLAFTYKVSYKRKHLFSVTNQNTVSAGAVRGAGDTCDSPLFTLGSSYEVCLC